MLKNVLILILIRFYTLMGVAYNFDREFIRLMYDGQYLNHKKNYEKFLSPKHITKITGLAFLHWFEQKKKRKYFLKISIYEQKYAWMILGVSLVCAVLFWKDNDILEVQLKINLFALIIEFVINMFIMMYYTSLKNKIKKYNA